MRTETGAQTTSNVKRPNQPDAAGASHDQASAEERQTNNFDFIRFLLATLVLVSHSTQLIDGNSSREPLARSTPDGLSLGFVAVNYFFLISGFLIVRSWLFTHGLLLYLHKRILRIYPAFVVAVLVSVLVVGAIGASSAPTYWQAMDGRYLWAACKRLITLRIPATPPTFEGLPFPSVNGAIWTVRYEFCCYLLVAAMGGLGICQRRMAVLGFTLAALVAYTAQSHGFLALSDTDIPVIGVIANWPRFATYFLAGMCFYLFRDKWRADWKLALGSALLVLLGCAFRGFSCVVLPVFGAYLLFYFAFMDAGALRRFGKRGDFSYGLFCYGWPAQNLILWTFHGKIHPVLFFSLSFLLALALAVGSWYAVEKPFLRWKSWKPTAKSNRVLT